MSANCECYNWCYEIKIKFKSQVYWHFAIVIEAETKFINHSSPVARTEVVTNSQSALFGSLNHQHAICRTIEEKSSNLMTNWFEFGDSPSASKRLGNREIPIQLKGFILLSILNELNTRWNISMRNLPLTSVLRFNRNYSETHRTLLLFWIKFIMKLYEIL